MMLVIVMIIIIAFLKTLFSNFIEIVFLKFMFESVEVRYFFSFFWNFIPQSRTNER